MQIARQTAEEHAKSLESYISEGENLAKDLGTRGPVRFDKHGKLDKKNSHMKRMHAAACVLLTAE